MTLTFDPVTFLMSSSEPNDE